MKKFSMLLSACLALLSGTGTVAAQTSLPIYYDEGTDVTEITPGVPVCMTPAGQTDYNAGNYMRWTGSYTTDDDVNAFGGASTISEYSLFDFEETGETVDGYPTYYV